MSQQPQFLTPDPTKMPMGLAVDSVILDDDGPLDMTKLVERVLAREPGWSPSSVANLINGRLWIRNHRHLFEQDLTQSPPVWRPRSGSAI